MTNVVSLPNSLRLIRELDFPHKLGILERIYGKRLSEFQTSWVECANGFS